MAHLEILASNERYTNRLSRQNTEDIVHRVSCNSQSNKTKKSQTLITQDVKTLVVLDWRNIETRQPTDVKRRELGHM